MGTICVVDNYTGKAIALADNLKEAIEICREKNNQVARGELAAC
jgi:hypothetical protein